MADVNREYLLEQFRLAEEYLRRARGIASLSRAEYLLDKNAIDAMPCRGSPFRVRSLGSRLNVAHRGYPCSTPTEGMTRPPRLKSWDG